MWAEMTQTTAGHTRALNRSVFAFMASEDTVSEMPSVAVAGAEDNT